MSTFVFMLHFRRALLAHPHHLRLRISALPAASGGTPTASLSQTWPALIFPSHLPSRACPRSSRACQRTSSHAQRMDLLPNAPTPLNSPVFLLHDTALPMVDTPESSNPALIRLGARCGCPSLSASRSASALLPNSRSTVRSSCRPTTLALRALQRRTAVLRNLLVQAPALRSMRALLSLTLPAFDTELLAAAPGTLTHLALPHFVGVPPCSA
ncbi:hypothetical protein EDB89DRAFT_2013711 [Lactarius sanguifluus]|nr:hypothetical protein EDB89DRAFT_2013711 [Lactarius sanguifluus]